MSPPSARAASMSRSPTWRVSNTGRIVGCIRPQTPRRGLLSPHDSSAVCTGSSRSASAVVSSGRLDRAATNGTSASAPRKSAAAGIANTGFTSWTMASSISPARIASASSCISA